MDPQHDEVEQEESLREAHAPPAEDEPDDRADGNDRAHLVPVPPEKARGAPFPVEPAIPLGRHR
jgi:hypothetical protein